MGAWEWVYELKAPRMGRILEGDSSTWDTRSPEFRQYMGCIAIRRMLNWHGIVDSQGNSFAVPENWSRVPLDDEILMEPESYPYNWEVKNAVRRFQLAQGLPHNGVVSRATMRALLEPRIHKIEDDYDIPEGHLCGMVGWESLYDPVATGWVQPNDRGLGQINATVHTDVSDIEAFDVYFSLKWSADRLMANYHRFVRDECEQGVDPWDLAIAAHNSPADAQVWCDSGAPPDEQIAKYVAGIKSYCQSTFAPTPAVDRL